jgi:uncharacterized membrane protein YeaQ/YmgE (transglycosylase-associated protein family)
MEFIASIDSVICVIVGAVIGWLAGQVMKGFGTYGNIGAGAAGGLIGGLVFDKIDVIDVGDFADPAIASVVGSVIAMALAGIYLRLQKQ